MQKVYLLKQNESLEKIAKIYQKNPKDLILSSKKLLNYNYVILENGTDDIILMDNYTPPRIHRVLEDDTKESLQAKGFELSKEQIEVDDIILLSKLEGKKHIVKPLETLDNIAYMYFTDKQDIINRNGLKTEKLFIGQILWI